MRKTFHMKVLLSYIFLASISSTCLFAQSLYEPGYIVNNSGDTIRGLIYMGSSTENCQKCIFKKDKDDKPVTYLPDDLQSYQFKNSLFYFSRDIMVENGTRRVFLEWAVKGKLNLYLYDDPRKAMRYYVDKGDSGFVELVNTTVERTDSSGMRFLKENKEYAATLAMMLQDCPSIIPEIYRSQLEAKDLIKLSADYQNRVCPDQQCTIFKRQITGPYVRLGPLLEYYYSRLYQPPFTAIPASAKAFSMIHYQPVNTFSAGVFLEIYSFPFLSPKLSLRNELTYLHTGYGDVVYGTVYALNRLRLSSTFKYSFTLGKLRPSLALGPVVYFRTSGTTYNKNITIVNSNGVEQTLAMEFPPLNRGVHVALNSMIGLDYMVSDKLSLGLTGSYEYLNQFVGYSTDQSHTDDIIIQLAVGYRLK